MGGCCSSSQKYRYHGTPVYYYCPPALEEHESLTTHESSFPTRLMIDINLDTSIPDTYRSPPRPIPFDVVLGIPQSTNSSPDEQVSGDLVYRKPIHVGIKELDTESEIPLVESLKKVDAGFQTSKCVDGLNIEEEDVCPTCFEEYDAENPRIVTKCNHQFHLSCILEWMERSDTCPICCQMSQAQPFSEGDNVEFESVNVEEEASQSQPQGPQPKRPRQSKKRSDVWNHFVEFLDGQGNKKSKCNYCGKEYFSSSKLGTTSLRTHLLHCASYKSTLNNSQTHLAFQEEKLVSWKFDQMISRKSIVQMIVEDELPFSFVEGKGFRNFVNIVQPLLKVPCRTTVTQDTLKMFEDHKKQVLELLKGNKSRICFTTDSWTSIKKDNYMVLTAHFINNDWRLTKKVLNFCLLDSHRGINIGKQIEECLLGWEIDKVMTISVDNAYANDFAIDYLRKRFASWPKCILKGKWIHIRCVAHILNLMVQDGMKQMNASINNIRGAVKWVRYSPSRLVNFRRYAKMEGCESTKSLCFDVSTRWNSTYLMLEAALVYEKAFDKYNKEDRAFRDDLEKLDLSVPSSLDWENARKLNRFLKQFYDVTLKVSGTHYVTSHTFFDDIMSIDVLLKDDTEGMKDLGLKEMITQMKVKFDKYYGDIEKVNLLLYIAVILDPRTKLGYLGLILVDVYGEKMGGSMKKVIEDALKELYDEYVRLHAPSIADSSISSVLGKLSSSEETKPNPTKRDQMLEILKMEKSKGGSIESTKSELDKYLNEDEEDNSKSFDILLWWKVNSMRFPILSMMARDILAIPISTVASESVFSTSGRVLDPFRSSLTPKIVEALICLQDWIRANPIPSIEEDFDKLHLIEEEIGSWCSSNKI